MGSNRDKSNIAIAILEKLPFLKGKKKKIHFDGSNNVFGDCNVCGIAFVCVIVCIGRVMVGPVKP